MTEEHGASAQAKTDAEIVREEWQATLPFDPELMRLVRFINAIDNVEVGVTLHVGGSVVSGMLISVAEFYRLLIKQFEDAGGVKEKATRDAAAVFTRLYRPPFDAAKREVEAARVSHTPPPSPHHLHLRYAQAYTSPEHSLTMRLWRGRLVEVDGWSIGNFGKIPPLNPQDT